MSMEIKLTEGPIAKSLLIFTLPMFLGNLLQQLYNIADTVIVGRYLGAEALAGVGSSFTLMTFITSIIIGLTMGCGAYFSILYGREDTKALRVSIFQSFTMTAALSAILNVLSFILLNSFIRLMNIPESVAPLMNDYLSVIFLGIAASFITNYTAAFLRSIGNSMAPISALAFSAALNIALDLAFILKLGRGVRGAAEATVISQYLSAAALMIYTVIKYKKMIPGKDDCFFSAEHIRPLISLSSMTALQQSVMNFGILMVQGIVNSFGTAVMAAFAAGVKIDAIAYMPAQDFGNAYSTFAAQNHGAGNKRRIIRGTASAAICVALFCIAISILIFILAPELIAVFTTESEAGIIAIGAEYLRTEGIFYIGIGILFMLYGFYRAIEKPQMSIILTVLSLGTRVLLSYTLSPVYGPRAIWLSIPIGWAIADAVGIAYFIRSYIKGPGKDRSYS